MTAIPVKLNEVGKPSLDLLGKDFPVGRVLLDVKTNASGGTSFTVTGEKDNKTGLVAAVLKAKHVDRSKGLSFTESWATNNTLGLQVEAQDNLVKGLKMDVLADLQAHTGSKAVKVGAEYKQDHVNSNISVDLFRGPVVEGDITIGLEGVVVGGQVGYNIQDGRITKTNAVAGYGTAEYSAALHAASNFNVFSASYHHRVSPWMEVAGRAVYNRKSEKNQVGLELGTKYHVDRDAYVKAKVDNIGRLGLGFTTLLRPGVKATIAGHFDTTRLDQSGVHGVGASLTFES